MFYYEKLTRNVSQRTDRCLLPTRLSALRHLCASTAPHFSARRSVPRTAPRPPRSRCDRYRLRRLLALNSLTRNILQARDQNNRQNYVRQLCVCVTVCISTKTHAQLRRQCFVFSLHPHCCLCFSSMRRLVDRKITVIFFTD